MKASNPPPPFRSPVVDSKGYLTDIWQAFFNTFYASVTTVPTGMIVMFSSNIPPTGWLLCDGSAVSRDAYSDLYGIIGNAFGAGDGSTTFNLPNPASKFIRGTTGAIGGTGGAAEKILTLENLPNVSLEVIDPGHTHTFAGDPHIHTITDPQHTHAFTGDPHQHTVPGGAAGAGGFINTGTGAATVNTSSVVAGGTNAASATGITIDPATATGTNTTEETGIAVNLLGESAPISLIPPYLELAYIIKY